MKRIIALTLILCTFVPLLACGHPSEEAQIVATTLPVYEFTDALCANTGLLVSQLINENVSCLHDYTLKVDQMRTLEHAELIVINGFDFEAFLDDVLPDNTPIIDAGEGIEPLCANHNHNDHHEHHSDPHIWLSPKNAQIMVDNIYRQLISKYPQYQATINENYTNICRELTALNDYVAKELAHLRYRKLITFHDGFAYMAKAFGLEVLYTIEEESGSEASAAELIRIIGTIESHKIDAIFIEKNGSASAAKIIAAQTGASIYQLDMAISGSDYFTSMYHNIDTIKEALG